MKLELSKLNAKEKERKQNLERLEKEALVQKRQLEF